MTIMMMICVGVVSPSTFDAGERRIVPQQTCCLRWNDGRCSDRVFLSSSEKKNLGKVEKDRCSTVIMKK